LAKEPIYKRTLLDLAAAFFLIGGVVALASTIVMIPIATVYPFTLRAVTFVTLVVLVVGIICAVEALECYSFASKRLLLKAGMRGIIVGAILLSLSVGLIGIQDVRTQLVAGSAILMIIGGVICYIYREPTIDFHAKKEK
jgi:uncharacterized BrkB/YihY/UPF0761 family membrane protein